MIERANSGKEYNHAELQQSIKKIQDKWPEDKKLPWVVDEMNVINKCKEINAQFRIRFNDIKQTN